MPGVRNVELVVLSALLLSAPSLFQAFGGGISVATAFVRLAVALALCWAIGAIIERVIDAYARDSRRRQFEARIARIAEARARLVQQARSENGRS